MGTVVQRSQGTNLFFFAKGAPEKIADLCVKTSGCVVLINLTLNSLVAKYSTGT